MTAFTANNGQIGLIIVLVPSYIDTAGFPVSLWELCPEDLLLVSLERRTHPWEDSK